MAVLTVTLGLVAVLLLAAAGLRFRDHIFPPSPPGDPSEAKPVLLDGSDLVCGLLRVPLADIKVVGEATNQDGPWAEDWFLCLVTGHDGSWIEIPMDSLGRQAYEILIRELRIHEPWQLAKSTDFASCVVWPHNLRGQEMFVFSPAPAKTSIGRWVRRRGLHPLRNRQTLATGILPCLAPTR